MKSPTSATGVSLCYGCIPLEHCRFGIEREELGDDGIVVSEVRCPPDAEGGPKVAHGGWTSSVMDELVGHTLVLRGELAVTGTLTIVFAKPVPIGWDLIGRAWITGRERRKVFVSATLELAGSGAAVASAEAIMITRPADHFDRHEEWLAGQTRPGLPSAAS